MAESYVALGGDQDDDDELGSTLSSQSSIKIRDRTQTPWKSNSPAFANPKSKTNVFGYGALIHEEIIANWKIYNCYKILLCLILLLFSLGSVSSGEAFRAWEESNDPLICDDSPVGGDTTETNIFGDFSIAALLTTLVVCIWSFFSYIRIRVIYNNTERNITIVDVALEKKLKRVDVIGIVIDFIVLTIGISILGTDISKDIANINDDCDIETYGYDGDTATSITHGFNVLHILYWVSILIVFVFIFISRYLMNGSNKQKWINTVNAKCCC